MSQGIRSLGRCLTAAAWVAAIAVLAVLAGAAPVLARTLHGGAHGRANALAESHEVASLTGLGLVALGLLAAAVAAIVVVDYRRSAREASPVVYAGHRFAPFGKATNGRRAA